MTFTAPPETTVGNLIAGEAELPRVLEAVA
jgi:hypothetical protein